MSQCVQVVTCLSIIQHHQRFFSCCHYLFSAAACGGEYLCTFPKALMSHTVAPLFFEPGVKSTFRCSKLTWKRKRISRSTTAVCVSVAFSSAVFTSPGAWTLSKPFSRKVAIRCLMKCCFLAEFMRNRCFVSQSNMSPLKCQGLLCTHSSSEDGSCLWSMARYCSRQRPQFLFHTRE